MIRKTVKEEDVVAAEERFNRYDMQDAFYNLAGETNEINWQELQKLLAIGFKNDQSNGIANTHITQSEAAPTMAQTQPDDGDNLLKLVISLICMTVCKDEQSANEFAPRSEEMPLVQRDPQNGVKSYVGFSPDVCRSMLAMYDDDCSGKMGFNEFKELWKEIERWMAVFKQYDHDRSTTISGFELRDALQDAGYAVNAHTLNLIMVRYGNNGALPLESFLMSIVKLSHHITTFQKKDVENTGTGEFTMDEWLDATMYC